MLSRVVTSSSTSAAKFQSTERVHQERAHSTTSAESPLARMVALAALAPAFQTNAAVKPQPEINFAGLQSRRPHAPTSARTRDWIQSRALVASRSLVLVRAERATYLLATVVTLDALEVVLVRVPMTLVHAPATQRPMATKSRANLRPVSASAFYVRSKARATMMFAAQRLSMELASAQLVRLISSRRPNL